MSERRGAVASPRDSQRPVDDLAAALAHTREEVDAELRRAMSRLRGCPSRLREAMSYSLFGGGKRLRPVLLLWTYAACRQQRGRRARGPLSGALAAACALEMLHTYSLIHDDLPAMDDDVLRRGRPTCHVAFDEATAILAGDGLHAAAFAVLADIGPAAAYLGRLVAGAVGPTGMVGGQMADLLAEGVPVDARAVRRIHERKTARLIAASLVGGGWLAGAATDQLTHLDRGGLSLGLAFQGADDLLDVTADAGQLGKTPGKDAAAQKATWLRVEGLAAGPGHGSVAGAGGASLATGPLKGDTDGLAGAARGTVQKTTRKTTRRSAMAGAHWTQLPIWTLTLLCGVLTQVIKLVIYSLARRRFDLRMLVTSAGLPSLHGSVFTCLTALLALRLGWSAGETAAGLVFSVIILHDAIRIKGASQEQRAALGELIAARPPGDQEAGLTFLLEEPAHRPFHVAMGMLLGLLFALACGTPAS
jgi:geranylgeranyl diphosphate synthase type II